MSMGDRSFTTGITGLGVYRYGFNGKENDSETGWEDYGMRMYNPTLARFFSVDPITVKYPELTPYQFASNRPINSIDLDGLEGMLGITLKFNFTQAQFKVHTSDDVITLTSQHWTFGLSGVTAGYLNKAADQVLNKDYSSGANITFDPRVKSLTFSAFNKFSKDAPYGFEGMSKTTTNSFNVEIRLARYDKGLSYSFGQNSEQSTNVPASNSVYDRFNFENKDGQDHLTDATTPNEVKFGLFFDPKAIERKLIFQKPSLLYKFKPIKIRGIILNNPPPKKD